MKQKHTLSVMTGLLVVSAALITGLASADKTTNHRDKSIMRAQTLDTNEDGAISFDELAIRQDRRFAKLDRNENGTIEKHEFNAHLITMFYRMDRNGDGELQGDELPGHRYGGRQHQHGDNASNPAKNS